MKKRLLVILMMGLFLPSAWGQQRQATFVKIESENFRTAPGGKIVGKLNSGTKLNVVAEEGQWLKVMVEGYIWKPSTTSDPTSVDGFQIRALHILLETENEARGVLDKLNAGEQFDDLAVQYSVDPGARDNKGDLGYFGRGDLVKEFEDVVFKLNIGQTSGIVRTKFGYHIIRRTE